MLGCISSRYNPEVGYENESLLETTPFILNSHSLRAEELIQKCCNKEKWKNRQWKTNLNICGCENSISQRQDKSVKFSWDTFKNFEENKYLLECIGFSCANKYLLSNVKQNK